MKYIILYILLFFSGISFAQETLSQLLKNNNSKSIPYISVQELAMPKTKAILLDSRELNEFEVSHLKNAIFVGYNNFNIEQTIKQLPNKQQEIVVYCSLGIRSEDIAEQLTKAGFTNVKNLYGGIFEWKNRGFKVFDKDNKETENVHTFSEQWSKWLLKGNKVFDKKQKE